MIFLSYFLYRGNFYQCVIEGHNTGALDGAPQCHLSILRNGNVPCRYFRNFPVDFKMA